ncbi:MAG: DUF4920 domain-containing protein [Bacteroidota bacterium]
MNKIISIFLYTFILLVSLQAEDTKKYGEDIALTEKTKISDIVKSPQDFVGEKVLVEGTVVNVCAKRGCWIELASDKEFESIRVKVQDGVIVFPMEAKGKKALVEGEVYSFEYEVEAECSGSGCKENEEKHEDCEHHKKETKTIYQIRGIGAEI